MNSSTIAIGIVAVGLICTYSKSKRGKAGKPDTDGLHAIGGPHVSNAAVTAGNDYLYRADASVVKESGTDIYGLPYQDVCLPGGGTRRVYGDWRMAV